MGFTEMKKNLLLLKWTNIHGEKCRFKTVVRKNIPARGGETVIMTVQKGKHCEIHDDRSRLRRLV